MSRAGRGRIPSLAAVITVVWCLGLAWAPVAHAGPLDGLPGGSDVSGAGDPVSGAVSDAGDAVNDAAGDVAGAVDQVGGTVSDAVGGASDAVDGVADQADSTVGGVTGSDPGLGEVVDGTTDGVTDAVDGVVGGVQDTVDEVGDTVGEVTDGAGEVVDEVTDGVSDGTGGATDPITDPIDGVVDGVGGTVGEVVDPGSSSGGSGRRPLTGGIPAAGVDGSAQPGSTSPAGDPGTVAGGGSRPWHRSGSDLGPHSPSAGTADGGTLSRIPAASIDAFARSLSVAAGALAETAIEGSEPASRSPWAGVFEGVADLAKRVAFPLALVLIVGGFLALHNKFDRRDPKLALAPIDQDQEVLHFE